MGMEQEPQQTETSGQKPRRFGGTRVRPRVQPTPPVAPRETSSGEPPLADEPFPDPPIPERGSMAGPLGSLFGPRTYAGGRVRVFGCSPGCLVLSLIISILLTLFLNALF